MTIPDEDTIQAFEKLTWSFGYDLPEGYAAPNGYDVARSGIYKIRADGQRSRVSYAPIIPVAVYTDPDGTEMLQLAWLNRDRWITKLTPRSVARSGRRLIAALGDAGLPAVESDAKALERWLANTEAVNGDVIPCHELANWLGWQPDGTFLASYDGPKRVEPVFPEQGAAIKSHTTRGTFEGWKAGIRAIEPYPVAKICLYAGFAATLLDVLKVDSFLIDIWGRSTRGKTTAAKIALSLWADPSDRGDGMFSWKATTVAIEKRLNVVRGLPVVIDETRTVERPETVDEVIYQVPKGRGKPRSKPWPNAIPWQTIAISTGEQSALSFTSHQGASARVLSISLPPFGSGDPAHGRAAAQVGWAVDENYGHAGPAFVERLQLGLAHKDGAARLVERHQVIAQQHAGGNDMSGRRAPFVAALILAAELAHEWGIVPFAQPSPELWLDLFVAEEITDNRPEMALQVAREFVAANASSLWNTGRTTAPNGGWIGRKFVVGPDKKTTVGLLPEKLKEVLRKAGYTLDAIYAAWQEMGVIIPLGKDRNRFQPVRALGEGKSRFYVFAPGAILAEAEPEGGESDS